MKKALLVLATLAVHFTAQAAPKPPMTAADSAARRTFVIDSLNNSLHYQQGHITLPGGISELQVPRGFRYLDSAQSRTVLTRYWGNPDGRSLGMLFPEKSNPLDDGAWAYVIEYDASGHVKDDDADDINYDDLLKDMREDMAEGNKERTEAGYPAVTLVGWASPPYYDKTNHTLHWAKTLQFGEGADNTLNYNVRILGRKGVLILNAVGASKDLAAIKASIPGLLSAVTFNKGQQYTDFNPGLDEVAAYGIGGLIAGKVLAKVGLFAVLLKFWKLGLLALSGAWAAIKRFFGGKGKQEELAPAGGPAPDPETPGETPEA
ncbi:DUF2167 domain-containing protein [Hymenobacter monticola]|uniref:DUF2167 domain-containing protein n=1 Tax=Hymenobacter monticola TaxID=1705399 RepID=A0ABY4B950_9BACT|nr:DUF2167 domain-containing protein [Hymenobacter monticola]UOE34216.1 DUF2167 domain-containing protein [Hymenobacter monticola]